MHMQGYLCEHRRGVAEILILLGLLPIITMFPTPGNPVYGTAALVVVDILYVALALCAFESNRELILSWKPNIPIFVISTFASLLFCGWGFSLNDLDLLRVIGPSAVNAGIWSSIVAAGWWRNPESQQHPLPLRALNGYPGLTSDAAGQV